MFRTLLAAAAVTTLAVAPAVAQQAAPAEAPPAQVSGAKFSTSTSTIGQLIDNADAKAAFTKVFPEVVASPQLEQGRDYTIQAIAQMVPAYFPPEKIKELDVELAKIK
jgi:hypothetical protein